MTPSSSERNNNTNNNNQDYELDATFSLKHNEDLTDDEVLSLLSDDNDGQQTLLPSTHHNNQSNASVFSFESIPMIPLTETQVRGPELQKKVSFLNGLGLVVGAMIGSGLFSSPGPVLEAVEAPGTALIVWFVSGLVALCGALCYAELGTMLPMNGGESVYLYRAFGSLISFTFEFVSIVVQKPGGLAIVCTVFGEYVSRIAFHTYFFRVPHDSEAAVELADSVIPSYLPKLLAVISLWLVNLINAFSTRAGIRVQDFLTILKVLAAIVISITGVVMLAKGTVVGTSFEGDPFARFDQLSFGQYSLAFYSGLWAYDGWNNLNYVSGEMKHPHRDLPRVIFIGIPIVIVCYLFANVAYLAVLRPQVVMHTNTVAMDFGKKLFGPVGGILLAVCVALSCFGTANAGVFTGSRIIYVSAKQGHIPSVFGKLNASRQTPITAIVLQGLLTTIMIIIGSFRALVNFYSTCAWIFYFLAVLSLLVFRYTEPDLTRPYRVWLTTPILFCIVALFLCVMPFMAAPWESFTSLAFVLLAIPIWLVQVKYREALGKLWDALMNKMGRRRSPEYEGLNMTETD